MSTLKQVFFNISFEAFSESKFLWSVITLMAVFRDVDRAWTGRFLTMV